MLPSDLSPELVKAIHLVGDDYKSKKENLEISSVRANVIKKIGELSGHENLLLDCLIMRTEMHVLKLSGQSETADYSTKKSKLLKITHGGKTNQHAQGSETGHMVCEFLFMVDPETFDLYNEDGELIDDQGKIITQQEAA